MRRAIVKKEIGNSVTFADLYDLRGIGDTTAWSTAGRMLGFHEAHLELNMMH